MSEEEKDAYKYLEQAMFEEETTEKYVNILLNYIDKLQKENEELKEELEKANKQMDLDYVDNNFISKDKIREVLKDIYFYYGQNNDTFLVDKIRKELLGE